METSASARWRVVEDEVEVMSPEDVVGHDE